MRNKGLAAKVARSVKDKLIRRKKSKTYGCCHFCSLFAIVLRRHKGKKKEKEGTKILRDASLVSARRPYLYVRVLKASPHAVLRSRAGIKSSKSAGLRRAHLSRLPRPPLSFFLPSARLQKCDRISGSISVAKCRSRI